MKWQHCDRPSVLLQSPNTNKPSFLQNSDPTHLSPRRFSRWPSTEVIFSGIDTMKTYT